MSKININVAKPYKMKTKGKINMFSGTNRLCRQCQKDCKQWEQVKIVACRNHIQKKSQTQKHGIPSDMTETSELTYKGLQFAK